MTIKCFNASSSSSVLLPLLRRCRCDAFLANVAMHGNSCAVDDVSWTIQLETPSSCVGLGSNNNGGGQVVAVAAVFVVVVVASSAAVAGGGSMTMRTPLPPSIGSSPTFTRRENSTIFSETLLCWSAILEVCLPRYPPGMQLGSLSSPYSLGGYICVMNFTYHIMALFISVVPGAPHTTPKERLLRRTDQ